MNVVVDGLGTKGYAMFFLEVVDCRFGRHTHFADVVSELLTDRGGHLAAWTVIAFAPITELLRCNSAIAGETLGTCSSTFGRNDAPSLKFIVER